jgi:pyroglutamyl-peptidase
MRVLVSGFEPFGGSAINPSQEIVGALQDRRAALARAGVELTTIVLPVDAARGPAALLNAIDDRKPDAALCLGESARATAITIERVFVNLADYRLPDNAGVTLVNQPIAIDGPAAYFASLPIEAMREAVSARGMAVEFSLSAGAYLCNHVAYAALHHVARQRRPVAAGFVHVPQLPGQRRHQPRPLRNAAMDLPTMIRAVEAMLEAIVWRDKETQRRRDEETK